jgi:hypothetical protein
MKQQTLRPYLIHIFQRLYRRKWAASRLYWMLAKRESREPQRELLQKLALKLERSAVRYAVRLSRLGGKRPSNRFYLFDRLWYWFLSCCPLRWGLSWLRYLEKRDVKDAQSLLRAKARIFAQSADRFPQRTYDSR